MTGDIVRIAVGYSHDGSHEAFIRALDALIQGGEPIQYRLVHLESSDWIKQVDFCDIVLWKPDYMGVRGASHFKEKIYFIEVYLKKRILPNFKSVWHFESKIAQSYLFGHYHVQTPKTFVSFNPEECRDTIRGIALPVVSKRSDGAGSGRVRLVRKRKDLELLADAVFYEHDYNARRAKISSFARFVLHSLFVPAFYRFVWGYLVDKEPIGALYLQEFIRDNDSDLRITVIGDRYVFGFWRKNRKNDFRASGSGRLDFERPLPEPVIRYCIDLNRRMGFDSMGYDILFTRDGFVIVEMSYGYVDRIIHATGGHYELLEDGTMVFRRGHFMPEEIWVKWALLDYRNSTRSSAEAEDDGYPARKSGSEA
jgi:glutathione synthase/RimK-type ligase-like ATP-grasp enzyme